MASVPLLKYQSPFSFALGVKRPKIAYNGLVDVVRVIDGDTIKVVARGKRFSVRLLAVDAPELNQVYGKESKEVLSSLVLGKNVLIHNSSFDKYGRTVSFVAIGGHLINLQLVKEGAVWFYRSYCPASHYSVFSYYENLAKRSGFGLWANPNPVNPSIFRHNGKF